MLNAERVAVLLGALVGDREALRAAVEHTIFFAREATHPAVNPCLQVDLTALLCEITTCICLMICEEPHVKPEKCMCCTSVCAANRGTCSRADHRRCCALAAGTDVIYCAMGAG